MDCSFLETSSKIYDDGLRARTPWFPLYSINVNELSVLECLTSRYCCDKSGAEQIFGHWKKLFERACSCAVRVDDLSLLPGDSCSMLHRKTVKDESENDLDTVCQIVSRFWRSDSNGQTIFAL